MNPTLGKCITQCLAQFCAAQASCKFHSCRKLRISPLCLTRPRLDRLRDFARGLPQPVVFCDPNEGPRQTGDKWILGSLNSARQTHVSIEASPSSRTMMCTCFERMRFDLARGASVCPLKYPEDGKWAAMTPLCMFRRRPPHCPALQLTIAA